MPARVSVVAGSERAFHSCAAQASARLTRILQIGSRAFRGAEDMEHATTHSILHYLHGVLSLSAVARELKHRSLARIDRSGNHISVWTCRRPLAAQAHPWP